MTSFDLTGLFVWRNVVSLGYVPMESFLSAYPMLDEALICVDPDSDLDTLTLCYTLEEKFSNVRVIRFRWPIGATGDGSVIGIASRFGYENVRTSHVINVQSDEVYPVELMEHIRDNWREWTEMYGKTCVQFKILHTQNNASAFQGGEPWDGRKDTEVWERGGLINGDRTRGGAGYNLSIKLSKKCPAISLEHDAWSFKGCLPHEFMRCSFSHEFPVVHLHDFFRDSYIAIRRNAGDNLWTDAQYGNYKDDADRIEATKSEWMSDPKWIATTSPFDSLLPEFVKPLIGNTSYRVRYELLDGF